MRKILNKFDFKGDLVNCREFGTGHINKTYLATFDNNSVETKYIIQQINSNVFKDVDTLMENIFNVTSYLRKKIKEYGGDENRETLHYIKTKDGQKYCQTDDNCFYRAYVFVKDSISFDSVDNPELFKSSGKAFGKFQKLLSDYPADTLTEIIPNFHNTKSRLKDFELAVKENKCDRKKFCEDEINFILNRKDDCSKLVDMIDRAELPLRVTHNDTKLNNVMFDEFTKECICVIDLDTVMPGLALYDFGDSIRFGANTAVEDEADLNKVSLSLEYFKAYAEGFLSEAGESLTDAEISNLAFASKLMTLECGMRFLGDYLNGDTYFATAYENHNLVRAKDQLKLVEDMENKMEQMNQIIIDTAKQYK